MSDNLCGPSAPTKGLVSHFDGNRPSQQGGIPQTTSNPSGASFRSQPSIPGGAAVGDAAFAAFTGGTPQMPAPGPQAGVPGPQRAGSGSYSGPGPHGGIRVPPGAFGSVPVHPRHHAVGGPVFSGGSHPRKPYHPMASDASWVRDFLQSPDTPARAASNTPWIQSFGSLSLHDSHGIPTPDAPVMVSQPAMIVNQFKVHQPNPNLMTPYQRRDYDLFIKESRLMEHAPENAAIPSPVVTKHYPEAILSNLADNTEAALEAAFAHYDEDFQSAMDDFIEANPPEGRTEANREAFMSEMEWEQQWRRSTTDDEFKPQTDRITARRMHHRQLELENAARDILSDLSDLKEKSESLKEKLRNSTFADMISRIAKGEVIVQDNDLIDVAEQEKQEMQADQAKLDEQANMAEQKGKGPA